MKWQWFSLPRVVLYLALLMIIAAVILHGIEWSGIHRSWENLLERPRGRFALRFLLQPTISGVLAIRDGIRDARPGGRSPFMAISDPGERTARFQEGIAATGKIFLIAIALDLVYQVLALQTVYPVEALVIAVFLAFIPYAVLRGPTACIVRRWQRVKTAEPLT